MAGAANCAASGFTLSLSLCLPLVLPTAAPGDPHPGNLLVLPPDDPRGRLALIDFGVVVRRGRGIARAAEPAIVGLP